MPPIRHLVGLRSRQLVLLPFLERGCDTGRSGYWFLSNSENSAGAAGPERRRVPNIDWEVGEESGHCLMGRFSRMSCRDDKTSAIAGMHMNAGKKVERNGRVCGPSDTCKR